MTVNDSYEFWHLNCDYTIIVFILFYFCWLQNNLCLACPVFAIVDISCSLSLLLIPNYLMFFFRQGKRKSVWTVYSSEVWRGPFVLVGKFRNFHLFLLIVINIFKVTPLFICRILCVLNLFDTLFCHGSCLDQSLVLLF